MLGVLGYHSHARVDHSANHLVLFLKLGIFGTLSAVDLGLLLQVVLPLILEEQDRVIESVLTVRGYLAAVFAGNTKRAVWTALVGRRRRHQRRIRFEFAVQSGGGFEQGLRGRAHETGQIVVVVECDELFILARRQTLVRFVAAVRRTALLLHLYKNNTI